MQELPAVNSFLLFAQIPELSMEMRIPLSIMNFLEFAVWGAWFVVLGNYLDALRFPRKDIGRIYTTMPIGTVVAPMFIGTIADRYFASEVVMGVLHLVGAVLLVAMAYIRRPKPFFWAALAYALVYAPTLALVNSIAFANIPDATRDFPTIRVLGTIGWIAAGMSLAFFLRKGEPVNNKPILLAAALSAILGVYSFFLPHTPPTAAGSGAQANAFLALATIEVKSGGEGYSTAPMVEIQGNGSGAAAEATVKDGKVTAIKVTSAGKDYTAVPKVVISGEGNGATADAAMKIGAVQVTAGGSSYQVAPAVVLDGGKGKGGRIQTVLKGDVVSAAKVLDGGVGYTAPPAVRFPEADIPFLAAFELLKEPSFAIFFGVSFLITLALAFYYSWTAIYLETAIKVPSQAVAPLMTIGQWMEIIFLFTLPWFLENFGMKGVLAIGMAAWGVRYFLFAMRGPLPLVIIGIALHGICFDFFFAAAFIHVANTAPSAINASAQSLFAVLTYGLGMMIGTEASGWLNQAMTKEVQDPVTGATVRVTDWRKFWTIPCAGVVLSLALFLAFFRTF